LKNKNLLSFSEQQLVDCSASYGNQGCNGGLMDDAFFYVIDNGITLESKYPYKGVGGKCSYTAADEAFRISNCVDVTLDKEAALLAAINQQPVSVAIEANHLSFQLYKSGVYSGNCGTKLDHGVLAVGFGDESGKGFFNVKNSWGSTWGENGYIRIERTGDGKGKCGIQMSASFSLA
jgi:KDEL-tailed cysteine endopeptidase